MAAAAAGVRGSKKERLKQSELCFQGWVAKSKLTDRAKHLLNELKVPGGAQEVAADRTHADDWIAIARSLHAIDSTSLYSAFVAWTRDCFPQFESQCQRVWQSLKPRYEFRSRWDETDDKEKKEEQEKVQAPSATRLCFLDR